MQDQNETAAFEQGMQAILAGEKEAPNKTLQHFADRFSKARAEQEAVAKNLQELEAKMTQGKTDFAKLTGFIEGLAVDLRHLWDEAHAAPATAPKAAPEIIPSP